MLSHALLRRPGENLGAGLSQAGEGAPDPGLALEQHQRYCEALASCGLSLTVLPADTRHPDGCFVEDTALVTARGAIVARPGAPSRRGEVDVIASALSGLFDDAVPRIHAPGTVDGGDVCEADGHFLIGLSTRTNEAGAGQLAAYLLDLGYRADIVDIRASRLLHLKSGIAFLGDGRMLATGGVPQTPVLAAYEIVEVPDEERYAANALRVNDRVLIAAGYPATRAAIEALGFDVIPLEMSEFRKLDGGLSCLSLRW